MDEIVAALNRIAEELRLNRIDNARDSERSQEFLDLMKRFDARLARLEASRADIDKVN